MRMAAVAERELTWTGACTSPLAEEDPGSVKHRNTVVAVAVRDVDVAVGRIHGDISRLVQKYDTRVRSRAATGTGWRIADPLRADLQ